MPIVNATAAHAVPNLDAVSIPVNRPAAGRVL